MSNETQIASLKDLVETKLTKGELVELVIGDMRTATRRELKAVQQEIKDITGQIKLDDLRDILVGSITVEEPYSRSDEELTMPKNFRVSVHINGDVALSKMPKHVQELLKRRHSLKADEKELNDRLQKLHEKGEAKNIVLKGLIEQTPEGKQFLQLLEGIKVKVDTRLLLAAKQ